MANIYRSLEELIGNTPLLELIKTEKKLGLGAHVLAKLEYFNPAGSVKDRVAYAMITGRGGTKDLLKERLRHHRAHQRQHRHRPGGQLARPGATR